MTTKKAKSKTVVVDRTKWVRGTSEAGWGNESNRREIDLGRSMMCNSKGNMCCLGHVALQCGFTQKQILYKNMPSQVVFEAHTTPLGFLTKQCRDGVCDTPLSGQAAKINDNSKISDKVREQKLKALFEKYGHKIKFVGKYAGGEIK